MLRPVALLWRCGPFPTRPDLVALGLLQEMIMPRDVVAPGLRWHLVRFVGCSWPLQELAPLPVPACAMIVRRAAGQLK